MKSSSDKSIDNFYNNLSSFTDKILLEASLFLNNEINSFKAFLLNENIDDNKSNNAYFTEFILVGLLMDKYAHFALNSLGKLNVKRNETLLTHYNNIEMPDYINNFHNYYLSHVKGISIDDYNEKHAKIFSALINWLKFTDEYKTEVSKLENWDYYFAACSNAESARIIRLAVSFAKYFEEQSRLSLGQFVNKTNNELNLKEKYISEAEFHLNIFKTEVLNRQYMNEFQQTNNNFEFNFQ